MVKYLHSGTKNRYVDTFFHNECRLCLRWSRSILYGTKIILYFFTHKAHPKRWKSVPLSTLLSPSVLSFFLKFNIIPCFLCSLAWGSLFGKKIQVLIKFESRGPLPTRDKGVSTRPKQQGRFVRIFGPDQSNLKYDKFMILFFYTDSTHEVKTRHAYGISTPWCYNRLQKLTWGTRNGNSVCLLHSKVILKILKLNILYSLIVQVLYSIH